MKFKFFTLILFISIAAKIYSQTSIESANNLVQVLVEKYMTLEGRPPGISVAVSQNNEIVFERGFGYADLSKNKPVTSKTQFRTASIAKLITATSLARLIQEGKIDINEPISKYLNSIPKEYSRITVAELAGHVGGVTHYSNEQKVEARYYSSIDDALSTFVHIKPQFSPGTNYHYSSYGYVLLSKVIETISKEPFLDYLDEQIFKPLNMTSTGPELKASPSSNMAELYDMNNEGINKGFPSSIKNKEDLSYKWAGGGFNSTPLDLVRLANAYTDGFFREDVVALMFKSLILNSGKETGVGLGWRCSYDMANRKVYEHAGYMRGTRSVLSLFPKEKISIAMMMNSPNLNRIEESSHMIALPFLTNPSPTEQSSGVGQLKVEIIDYDGNLRTEDATLVLNGETDRLILANKAIYPLVYMQRDNIYALIHQDGILYSELNIENGNVNGRVMRYKSPLPFSPNLDKPFMKLSGEWN